jgi:phosphohistidine phosphatase
MKILYLLRHAKATSAGPAVDDHARPLSRRGRHAAALIAGHIADLAEPPELILASDSVRTRETLHYLAEALKKPAKTLIERELYLASSDRLLARLRRVEDAASVVLLLAHNPGLHELALRLAAAAPRAAERFGTFPTAALVVFAISGTWSSLDAGSVRFRGYVTPGDLSPSDGDDE